MNIQTKKQINIIPAAMARKNISEIINQVSFKGGNIAIGRRNKPEVLLIKFPQYLNPKVNEITNINANSDSFKFLEDEPDIYSVDDLKKKYV